MITPRWFLLPLLLTLGACAPKYDPSQPVRFAVGTAIPVDIAVPHLHEVVDERITVSGLARQRDGLCRGVQPLTGSDWMLTGERECLWVSGRVPGARLLDVRAGLSKEPITVSGRLIRTDSGQYVLKAERTPPPAPPAATPTPAPAPTMTPTPSAPSMPQAPTSAPIPATPDDGGTPIPTLPTS